MIIPTPEYDPLFACDGIPFQRKMLRYIEREFADLLQSRPQLLADLRNLEPTEKSPPRRHDRSTRTAA